ncbi:energy-coupling factor transporter transmembrane protein EcfT [Ktedonosporobacter rubrisoli]|uniref:Energy-coupling factor transporter transmembrane protein EcfT n=1 Tax=Ktedonosporobacter rubrisoli TaxID=2509675 RepID=A0A4P6K2I6_KTERU|nr:energy-coupling factor transporter transmembrane component T [Ktedonosporobacter rubrisoli]QBD82427.1 energy-coupling factor transporter transmembrane protein EcfT [Ktedonosporobacter rubrisoli]
MLITFSYIKRDSFVHRLDPRVKFILLFAFSLIVIQTSNFWFLLGGLIAASYYYSQARLKWAETKTVWIFIIILTIFLVIVNYFISAGAVIQGVDLSHQHIIYNLPFIGFISHPPYVGFVPLVISVESLVFLLTQTMRNIGIALFVVPIPFTIDPAYIGVAFRGMGVPDKISYAVDLSFRFLPTIARDFSTTLDAQRARGFEMDKLRGGLFAKIAKLAPMIVPVIIGSVVGAEDIISAMELRCFGIGKRSWLIELQARQTDRLLITLSLVILALTTLLNVLGYFVSSGPLYMLHTQGIPGFLLP